MSSISVNFCYLTVEKSEVFNLCLHEKISHCVRKSTSMALNFRDSYLLYFKYFLKMFPCQLHLTTQISLVRILKRGIFLFLLLRARRNEKEKPATNL
jgi:hypothetical protein